MHLVAPRFPALPPRTTSQSPPTTPGPEQKLTCTAKEQRAAGPQGHLPAPSDPSNLKHRMLAGRGRHRACLRGCN